MSGAPTVFEQACKAVEPAMWSPASGPVVWTPEKIEAAKSQARAIVRAVLLAIREPAGCAVAAEYIRTIDAILEENP